MIRLVATDLDGTLVRSDGTVSERTQQTLIDAEAAGIEVVFVTGRPLRWAREVFAYVGGHGLALVSNGGLVWDVGVDRPALERGMNPADAVEVCRLIAAAVPDSHFALETADGIAIGDGFIERYPMPEEVPRGPIESLLAAATRPVVKLLARHESVDPMTFWTRAEEAVGDSAVITWSSAADDALLEISAAGVTKATTLKLLCDQRGITPDQVVAFGDMPNDIAMLEWAGTAYAMANAHATAKAAADRLAPSNDDDGVARVLESLLW